MLRSNASRAASALLFSVVSASALALTGCGSAEVRQADGADLVRGSGAVLSVEGLGCPMCAESIHVLLDGVDGVADSSVNLGTGTVDVVFEKDAAVSRRALASAVTDGGFSLRGIEIKE